MPLTQKEINMSDPLVSKKKNTVRLGIDIDADLMRRLKVDCASKGITAKGVVVKLITDHLKN